MKVTATELANATKSVVERVIQRGERAEIQRHGQTVAEIRRKVEVNRREMQDLLASVKFSKSESTELKGAMDAAAEVLGSAGGD